MINYQAFSDKYYQGASEAKLDDVKRFIRNLNEIIGDEMPVKRALKNKQILCRAFFLGENICEISRPHYQKIKNYLLNLFDYYNMEGQVPTREAVLETRANISYFRSLDDVLQFIDSVGEARLEWYNPTADLMIVKGACVLGWLGFSYAEMSELKRSDLKPIGLNGFEVTHGDEVFAVYGAPFSVLYYLRDLESYRGIPSGRKIVLANDSEYLFRPSSGTQIESGRLLPHNITLAINRFNRQIPAGSKTRAIAFMNLRKNALFLKVYEDKTEESLVQKIARIMHCTPNYALSYKEQYLRFVKLLESNQI